MPTIYVLSRHKKNITTFHLKINIFTADTYRNILYGRVIVMHVETASSLFDMRSVVQVLVFARYRLYFLIIIIQMVKTLLTVKWLIITH